MRRLLTALLFVLLGLVGAPTTTAAAAAYTYDASAFARVDVHEFGRAGASPTQFSGSREGSASPSVESWDASTTPVAVSNATNSGSRIAANQAAGNSARDALAAAHPGSLIEQTFTTGVGARRLDVLTQTGIGIESKVGRTSLTAVTRSQIAKDSWLLQNSDDITGIQSVFSRSGVTGQIGPTGPLADALSKAGIPWSVAP